MKVAIVKYNAGNVQSVKNSLDRLGVQSVLTDDPNELVSADRVIFPGVGEASTAMGYLRERHLDTAIRSLVQPVLAICLGMQLLCRRSEENETDCLDILPYDVRRFSSDKVKVPHMGWNNIRGLRSPLFEGVPEDSQMYFVHSYFVGTNENTLCEASYMSPFSAAIGYKNFFAVQFHPEKSHTVGAQILNNFLQI